MPNANYLAGVRLERARKKHYEAEGYTVVRASGSHGCYDLVCLKSNQLPLAIQCKYVSSMAIATRLLKGFVGSPPLPPSRTFCQRLEAQVRGSSQIYSIDV